VRIAKGEQTLEYNKPIQPTRKNRAADLDIIFRDTKLGVKKMIYDEAIDKECRGLCDALNSIPGISTSASCCGHGKQNFRIWFSAIIESLWIPAMACNRNYCGHTGWRIEVVHAECPNRACFCLEGPIGEEAYAATGDIEETIERLAVT